MFGSYVTLAPLLVLLRREGGGLVEGICSKFPTNVLELLITKYQDVCSIIFHLYLASYIGCLYATSLWQLHLSLQQVTAVAAM